MITQEVCKFVLSFFLHSKTNMVCGCRRLRRMVYEEMLFKILHLGVLTFFSSAKDFSHLFSVKKGIFASTRSISTSQSKKWPNWGDSSSSVQGSLTQMYMLRTLTLLLQLFDEGQGGNKKELLFLNLKFSTAAETDLWKNDDDHHAAAASVLEFSFNLDWNANWPNVKWHRLHINNRDSKRCCLVIKYKVRDGNARTLQASTYLDIARPHLPFLGDNFFWAHDKFWSLLLSPIDGDPRRVFSWKGPLSLSY